MESFADKERINFLHWVNLHSSPLDDDFNGVMGRDQRGDVRIKIAYEVSLKSEEKKKKKKRTKETDDHDSGSHDSSVRERQSAPEDGAALSHMKVHKQFQSGFDLDTFEHGE